MAEDIYVTSLRRAAQFHGSTQALAAALRVPGGTLLRWMAGRAMMPEQAFARLVHLVMEDEARSSVPPPGPRGNLSYRVEDLVARCGKCGGEEFSAHAPARLADPVACLACGEQIVHRDLLLELAERAASRRRARAAARKRPPGARPLSGGTERVS